MVNNFAIRYLTLAVLSSLSVAGQTAPVLATGLLNPTKLILTPGGNLLVTEAGSTPNSGRVSFVDKSGVRRTLIDALPSGLSAPNNDVDGPTGLAMMENRLRPTGIGPTSTIFIEIGEGDSFRNGTKANTIVPNPNGPSSPIFASILQLELTQQIDNFTGGFTLAAQDQSTLAGGNPVTLKATTGETATLTMLTYFRNGVPDPVSIWRNSHPYAMTLHPNFPNSLFVADAGMNQVSEINLASGRAHTLVQFASVPSHAVPPVSEPVPDSIRPLGNLLMVSFLTGFPFTPGTSEVVTVNPTTGAVTPFIASLSSAIDVLDVPRTGPRDLFFTLEYSTNMGAGAPGAAIRYDTAVGQTIASGLNGPTSMAYDASTGNLYVVVRGDGTIVKIAGQ